MRIYLLVTFLILLTSNTYAGIEEKVKKLNWDGLEVIWLEDERFPTYSIQIYFADGALSDQKNYEGETSYMFDLLDTGTRRFSHKDIVDNLEFFGVSYGANVTHEYSSYKVSGLVKDIVPTMKKICHIFKDATYPKNIISKELARVRSGLETMVNSPAALASRSFRELSLGGTVYSYPAEGKLSNLKRMDSKRLKDKLNYFNNNVKKRIYIAGPTSALVVENILKSDCGWSGKADFVRGLSHKVESAKGKAPDIHLVTVAQANQAQVRIGRYLGMDELGNEELKQLVSEYLGGGFTSQLMREIRVKRGLTYGIGSMIGLQKFYGRSFISTSTRVDKVQEMLEQIQNVLGKINSGEVLKQDFERSKGALAGSHPFRFEALDTYLAQLLISDHIGRDYKDIYQFPNVVRGFNIEDMVKESKNVFDWNKQTIVVLGPKNLAKALEKFGKVKVHNYKEFL